MDSVQISLPRLRRLSMANLKLVLLSLTAAGILGGCVNEPKPGTPESAALIQEKKIEKATEALEDRISEAPDWYLTPPASDFAIYGIGDSLHSDLSTARRAATLKAQAAIAESTESYIASQTKVFFDGDTFGATGNSDIVDQVIKNVVRETQLRGAKVKDSKFVAVEGKVQAYVLVEYPIGAANQALVDQIKKDATLTQQARRSEAFKELEKEVERLKQG